MIISKYKNKYKLEFEDVVLITYEEVILNNNLMFNKENFDYDKILKDHLFYEGYYKTLSFIEKKIRSKKEVLNFILKNGFDSKIIEKLENINLINDDIFCSAYVADKFNLTNDGLNKIYKNLLKMEISIEIIEKHINKISKEQVFNKLNSLVKKKFKCSKCSNAYLKQKILNELFNLGFELDDIKAILNDYNKNDFELYKKEYDKLYKKYSLKYKGIELEYKIKSKLIQKGFKAE